MSTKSRPNGELSAASRAASPPAQENPKSNPPLNHCPALQRCFHKSRGGWFVQHGECEKAGPFVDKAEAQMAMLYYSARMFWPSEKQLREFTRSGK